MCSVLFEVDRAQKSRRSEEEQVKIKDPSLEEMEEFLRTVDSVYRLQRRKLLQTVIKKPELMEPVIKTVQKGWNYMKKLFANYNIWWNMKALRIR